MSSGKVHAAITITTALGLGLAREWITHQPRPETLAICAGCLAGVLLTPDLDVEEPTHAHTVAGRFGWGPALLWRLLWLPYGTILRHRSFWSHAPFVGTAMRVLYLFCLAWLLAAIWGYGWVFIQFIYYVPWWWNGALGGLIQSDLMHWGADNWPTGL